MRTTIVGMMMVAMCWGAGWALAEDGAALTGRVCAACHGMAKVEAAYGVKDKDAWTITVNRMLAKSGAPTVGAEERAVIIDWLGQRK